MQQSDTVSTKGGPLEIQPVDHASLVLRHGAQVIYVDPVGGAARYQSLARPSAILITHEHSDHFDVATLEQLVAGKAVPMLVSAGVREKLPAALKAQSRAVGYGDRGDLNGVPVRVVEAYNTTPDRLRYHPKGLGNGYVLTFSGTRVYIAGDTEPNPDMLGLKDIDIAFLPMNLPYTMVAGQAAEAVKTFRPKIVYPFHYTRGPEPETFAGLMEGVEGIEVRLRDWYPEPAAQ
ncbi:MAG TPA: MBL fold metallo-hydrolase [Devosia sp.]|nr:MBL fold metallo-hydrolase [Devosia sp.]